MKITPLDKLFSEFIRKRAMLKVGGCERCLTPKYDIQKENGDIFPAWQQLQCAHLLGRWQGSTRWDEDNAIGACGGCHRVLDRDHLEKETFLESHLGQKGYNLLKARARITYPKPDKEALRLYFLEGIKQIEADHEGTPKRV